MKNTFTINLHLYKRIIYVIVICIFMSLFFNSCKNNDIVEEDIKPIVPKCLITKIAFPNSPYFADFEYNEVNQLVSINNQLDISEFDTFEYDQKGNCVKISLYDGTSANIQKLKWEFNVRYDSKNLLTEIERVEGNNKRISTVKTNDKKQIVEIDNVEQIVHSPSIAKFEYDSKGSLIKRTLVEKNNPTKIQYIYEYEYDEKNNPFNYFPFVVKNYFFVGNWGSGVGNITRIKEISGGIASNIRTKVEVQYEYNSDGFPIIYRELNRGFSLVYNYKCQ